MSLLRTTWEREHDTTDQLHDFMAEFTGHRVSIWCSVVSVTGQLRLGPAPEVAYLGDMDSTLVRVPWAAIDRIEALT